MVELTHFERELVRIAKELYSVDIDFTIYEGTDRLESAYVDLVTRHKAKQFGLLYGHHVTIPIPAAAERALLDLPIVQGLSVLASYVRIIEPTLRVSATNLGNTVCFHFGLVGGYRFMAESIAVIVYRLVRRYYPGYEQHLYFEFPFQQPSYIREYHHRLGTKIRFNRASMMVELSDCTSTLATLSNIDDKLYVTQLQQQLHYADNHTTTTALVLSFLAVCQFTTPSKTEAAQTLGISERTLSRRLASENTSYRELVATEHFARARQLLRYTRLTQTDIATVLGYDNCANFRRAYQRWAGYHASKERNQQLTL